MPDAPSQRPKVFGIGLPYSDEGWLAALFQANGYVWQHHARGKLAKSIAYAQATGGDPLALWPDAVGVSGLSDMEKRHLPYLRVQDSVRYLRDTFPNAYFIHTHRDPADWIAARFWAEDGDHRMRAASLLGCSEADLPDVWMREQAEHAETCAQVFADHPRFLLLNMTTATVETVAEFVAPDYTLTPPDVLPDLHVTADRLADVVNHVSTARTPSDTPADMNFAQQVIDFCAQRSGPQGKMKHLNTHAIHWNKAGDLRTRLGDPAPLALASNGTILRDPAVPNAERAQATLNDLITHGAQPPLLIDMMDARFIGSEGRRAAPARTVAYNRRQDATNLTLWPLPGYHSIAPTGTPQGYPKDAIPFANKADRVVWLGNMTGRMSPVLTPDGRELRGVYNIRDRMEKPDADWDEIIADLSCVPRYNAVKTYRDHPDFDVGLVLRARWKRLQTSPAFDGLCTPFQPRTHFHGFKYVLSLAGNDTGSNFLSTSATNSLILKEEDGWELFYTDLFKPWNHYVPLAEGALDVEDKLRWARENQGACEAMVAASTEVFNRLANPNTRAAILRGITEHLNASR